MDTNIDALRPVDRWAATWLCGLSGLAILFWGVWIGASSFSEPPQLALVGYEAPWRKQSSSRFVVAIGRDRQRNDIVLHDRKASTEHLILERRGGKGRRWAQIINRTPDRRITLRRASPLAPPQEINRRPLRDGDTLLLPWPNDPLRALERQRQDRCSPSLLLQTLQLKDIPSFAKGRFSSFLVREHRAPLRIMHQQPHLSTTQQGRPLGRWLMHHQRYELPQATGFQWLEYRQAQWLLFSRTQQTWQPLQSPITWGKPPRTLSLQRRPHLQTAPLYTLQHAQSACAFPLAHDALPGGLEIGKLARLFFQHKRLFLQHLGQSNEPIQVIPRNSSPLQLGAGVLRDGDHLSLGQIRYRVILREDSVRLIADAQPTSRSLIPFFAHFPSETLPARKLLHSKRALLVSGGEGDDPRADRWLLHTSLIPRSTASVQGSPQRPILRLTPHPKGYTVTPLEETTLYRTDLQGDPLPHTNANPPKPPPNSSNPPPSRSDLNDPHTSPSRSDLGDPRNAQPTPPSDALGTSDAQPITQATTLPLGPTLYRARGLYLRLFQPSYQALAVRIALLWVIFGLAMIFLLFWLLQNGHLRWSPVPSDALLRTLPTDDPRRRAWLKERPRPSLLQSIRLRLLSLPILLLLPLALFLNGLGLYVLASLSLASLGLNHSDFLYRQVLWSLVGILLFLLALIASPQSFRFRRDTAPPPPPLVPEVTKPSVYPWGLIAAGAISLIVCVAFLRAWLWLPVLVLYVYGRILQQAWLQSEPTSPQRQALYAFFATLSLLALVPLLGLIAPPLVHNRFFLKVPFVGTIKLSDAAILTAIVFFAYSLGPDLFALRLIRARRRFAPPKTSAPPESSIAQQRNERLGGALRVAALYLLLLGSIALLYTIQGDLGPGLILTLCFSLFLLFSFMAPGPDRLTTLGNFLRIGVVFAGIGLFVLLPEIIAWLAPDLAAQQSEIRKVQERLSLWRQPWRFLVGEQILQNIWALAAYKGTFQWFNNLHSDFVFTAVVRVLSPTWGLFVIAAMCFFPLAALATARLHWLPILPNEDDATLDQKRQHTTRTLILLFGGIYLFAQHFIHIGSVLRLTPMTGVTLPWISSGGTSLVVCYLVIALIYRQLRLP